MLQVIANLSDQRDRFLGFVERRVRNRSVAEDILQAAYARAISQLKTLKTQESATAWFFRILRNAVIDHYRHTAVEGRTFEPWTPEIVPETVFINEAPSNTCKCIDGALNEINPAYQEVVRQIDLEEIPLSSFAQHSGITPGNAAVRAHRARQALRKQLIHRCGVCAKAGCLDCTCRSEAAHHG